MSNGLPPPKNYTTKSAKKRITFMAVGECTHLKPFVTEHDYQLLNSLICHINFESSAMYVLLIHEV